MGSRILIVEDEQIIAEDLAIEVRRLGHDVVGISISGEEAVAMAEAMRPDIVMMDIQLGGKMTGADAAHRIQEGTAATIVFVTAFPNVVLREDCRLSEPGICVNKPFSPVQLEAALRAAGANRPQPGAGVR